MTRLPYVLRPMLLATLVAGCAATPDAPSTAATPAAAASAAAAAAASAPDPYLWLEKVDSPEAMSWVHAENDKTLSVLEKDPRFATFNDESLAIAQTHDRIPFARQIDGSLFNFWQDAEHVRGIWRKTTARDYDAGSAPHWKTVLDLDKVSTEEHANWVWHGADCDARRENRCLLSLSDGGEDASTIREFDLRTGKFVAHGFDLPKSKQSAAWETPDSVLVSREWTPGELTTSSYPYIVKRLHRGQPLGEATEIFRGKPSDVEVDASVMNDAQGHQALMVQRQITAFESEEYLVTPDGVKKLSLPLKASVQDLFDGQLMVKVQQDWQAGDVQVAQGSLVSIDLKQATAHPDDLHPTIVFAPNARQSIDGVASTKDALVITSLDNVRGRAAEFRRAHDGTWTSTPIALPDNTTVSLADASDRTTVAYLSVTGYLQPNSQWRIDTRTHAAPRRLRSLPAQFDASKDEVEQFEATSTDGTKIPYFIVHPKGMALDGSHPTILYAYGGFEISISPRYSGIMGKLWLERGGVFVVANIRGGGEFGPAWHEAGLKTKRQTIYDDFASVAQDLIARNVTTPRRLGIQGGSNGGLLMGVEMTQHPDLWNAVDIQVPLLDMLRYEQIAAGASWVGEYGSVSVPEERDFLAKISPYNQLKPGVKYPKALVWTTTKDDRVGPQHARKFAARLAEYGVPYYFYEVTEGGHGAGANLKESAHTSALEFTYFSRQLMDE